MRDVPTLTTLQTLRNKASFTCPSVVWTETDEPLRWSKDSGDSASTVFKLRLAVNAAADFIRWTFQAAKDPLQLPALPFFLCFSAEVVLFGLKYTHWQYWILCHSPLRGNCHQIYWAYLTDVSLRLGNAATYKHWSHIAGRQYRGPGTAAKYPHCRN